MSMQEKISGFAGAIIAVAIGFGLILAGNFVGSGIVNAKLKDRVVTVRGVAERPVKADVAFWPIRYTANGDDLTVVQRDVDADTAKVKAYLIEQGFKEEEISLGQLEVTDYLANGYEPNRIGGRYTIAQTLNVRSNNVDLVANVSRKTGDLVRRGVVIQSWTQASYVYTKLNDIRAEMIAEATKSARDGAEQFAKDSKSHLGGIKTATQGYFEIQGRDVSDTYMEANQVEKTARVVTTVTYILK